MTNQRFARIELFEKIEKNGEIRMSYIIYSTWAFAVAGILFSISAIIVENFFGSPSSTSAIGYVLVPFMVIPGGAVGLVVGTVYWALGSVIKHSFFQPSWENYTRVLWGIVLFIVIILPLLAGLFASIGVGG